MTEKEKTEEKIIEAARQVFLVKGFDGARMQEIADTAEINKGLLHYYFKSKNKLFEMVFGIAFETMFARMTSIINADQPLFDKIRSFCHSYISLLSVNSYLPRFVLNELGKNPENFVSNLLKKKMKPNFRPFFVQIEQEIEAGNIRNVEPLEVVVNMMSLCVFPFIGKPIFQVMLNLNPKQFEEMIETRKTEVAEFIIQSLKK